VRSHLPKPAPAPLWRARRRWSATYRRDERPPSYFCEPDRQRHPRSAPPCSRSLELPPFCTASAISSPLARGSSRGRSRVSSARIVWLPCRTS